MRFTKTLKYNLKRALPILAIAGAGMMTSCSKDDEPQRDVELKFSQIVSPDEVLALDVLQKYVDDPSVRNIYMYVEGDWTNVVAKNIQEMKDRFYKPRIELSPKIHGRGNWTFKPGEASKVPEDSLWYVQQGWTINKHLQKQK